MSAQSFVVLLCVGAALAFLLRPAWQRWRSRRRSGETGAPLVPAPPPACGACKGCQSPSRGCH